MKTALLREFRKLRYKLRDDLIGRSVQVRSFDSLEGDLRGALGPLLPDALSLTTPRQEIAECFGKYRFLDLQFVGPGQALGQIQRPNLSLLREFGFLNLKRQQRKTLEGLGHSDPEGMGPLISQASPSRVFLLLFLGSEKAESRHSSFVERWSQALGDSKNLENADAALAKLMEEAEKDLPKTFTVEDACLTNSPSIWSHKHFWL